VLYKDAIMKRMLIFSLLCAVAVCVCGQGASLSVSGTQVQMVKVFDNSDSASVIYPGVLNGVAAGDTVTLAAVAHYVQKRADTCDIVVNYSISGPQAAMYNTPDSMVIPNGVITKRQLYRDSVVLDSFKIYDGDSVCPMLFNGIARNYVTHHILTLVSAYFEDVNVGENKLVHVTFGMNGEDEDCYIPPRDTIMYSAIRPRLLTVSGTQVKKTKVYDGTTAAEVISAGSLRNVTVYDSVVVSVRSAEFEDKNVGNNKFINVYYELSGDTMNYEWPESAYFMNGKITPKKLTAEGGMVECSKDYDSTTHAVVTLPSQPVGVIAGEQVYLTTNAEFEDAEVGTGKEVYCWYQIYGRDMANYDALEDSVVCTDGEIRSVTTAVENGEATLMIYPNPARDHVWVSAEKVVIYTITGVKVYEGEGGMINLSAMANGVYMVNGEKLVICR